MQGIAGDVEGRDPQPGVVNGPSPAREGFGMREKLRRPAVRRRRVAADADLQVLDQPGAARPGGDIGEAAIRHCVGQQANTDFHIGAFQTGPKVWPAGGFVNRWRLWPSALARHGVAFDQLLVELEAKAGPIRDGKAALGIDPWLVSKHLAQRRGRPAGRLVGKLEP